MFALEISFKGDEPASETIFVRRPAALIGSRESSHVLIDDMAPLGYGILITRDIGRRFKLSPIAEGGKVYTPQFLDGVYEGEAVIDLGPVVLHLVALDIDLLARDSEPPDRAGVRVLRQACSGDGPRFPAILLLSQPSSTISFAPEHPLLLGRSRQCAVRLDSSSVSEKHARVGYESGEFWVEDLGSTNGTFVNQQQISGRMKVDPGVPISLGRDVTFVGVLSAEDATGALATPTPAGTKLTASEKRYPLLLSLSETARPAQVVLVSGSTIELGRDPSSDMWLGVPHVSRRHCAVECTPSGVVRITDQSTNGTRYEGKILKKDQSVETTGKSMVLDFGGGVTVAICFSQKDEERFIAAGGAAEAYMSNDPSMLEDGAAMAAKRSRRRSKTTFLRAPEEARKAAAAVKGVGVFRQLYARLSGKGRLAMAGAILGIIGVGAVIGGLLIAGLR
jgi:pSer/pThr/pTyr-binding forkhead associated (FHA) protein